MLLVVRLSSNGASLWIMLYYVVPGAKAIRATGRFVLWLSFPLSLATAILGNKYIKSNILGICLFIFVFIFNINTDGVYSRWNIKEEYTFLNSVKIPPSDAEVIYIINPSGDKVYSPMRQLDAMDIAYKYNLQTINGYSGAIPNGYEMITLIFDDDYENSVKNLIISNNIRNVYAYDMISKDWNRIN